MSVQFAPEAERNADQILKAANCDFFFFFCLRISFNFPANNFMYMLPLLKVMHYAWQQMGSKNGAS